MVALRRLRLRSTVVLTVLVTVTGLASAARGAAHTGAGDPETRALKLASDTSQPVVVDADTTQTSLTEAEPDGSLQTSFSAEPVRVHQNGAWVPVDASLAHNSDGSYSPAATPNSVRLSGGGEQTLAVMHDGENSDSLTLSWPTTLPAPTIDGATATYAEVLPGVDLRVTASTQGAVSETLVVKTAAAAANPALATLRLSTAASGLTLATDEGGNLSGTDSAGNIVLHAATPLMWDSRTTTNTTSGGATPDTSPTNPAAAPTTDATAPGVDSQVAAVGVAVSGDAITLTPDQDLLTGADTSYPLYIDPTFVWHYSNATHAGWTWAQQAFPTSSWWQDTSNGNPAVGYQGWTAGSYGQNISYWQYSIGNIAYNPNVVINNATLYTTQTHSGDATCSNSYRIDLYGTGEISPSTTWNNKPGLGNYRTYANIASCAGVDAAFNVTSEVNADGNGTVTFALHAHNETSKWYYKRFTGSGTTLRIKYDRRPNIPTNLAVAPAPRNPAGDCTTGGSSIGWIGATSQITLSAHVSDPDTAANQSVAAQFHLWDSTTGTDVVAVDDPAGATGAVPASGGTVSKAVPATKLHNGHLYAFNAWAYDGYLYDSTDSAHCYFRYDNTAPQQPSVTSNAFNLANSQKTVGQSGTFTLSANEVVPTGATYSKINHFAYSTSSKAVLAGDGGTHKTATLSGSTGTATISLTPTVWGINYLYVAAVDNAGNESSVATYPYYVPDDSTATVHPGDVDGDGHPDLLAAANNGDLLLYPTVPNAQISGADTHTATACQPATFDPATCNVASTGTESPDGTSWANTLITHRSSPVQSPTGARVDDLYALKTGTGAGAGVLFLYTNNINHTGGRGTPGDGTNNGNYYSSNNVIIVDRPFCTYDSTACSDYSTDWTATTQILAPGDVDGDGIPDLITVEDPIGNTHNGELWFFRGSTNPSQLTNPQRIGDSSWNHWHIIAPGDDTGDGIPDIWAADNRPAANGGSGQLRLYPINVATNGTIHAGTGILTNDTIWGPDTRAQITSPGDIDNDGIPDLYTIFVGNPDQLWENPGYTKSATTFDVGPHALVDDGTTHNWNQITELS